MLSTRFLLRSMLTAGTALGLTLAAQAKPIPEQKAGEPPVGSNNVDRPESADPAVLGLASMTMPITATPADKLPIAKLHVPDGFEIEVYASGLANGRSMQLGDKGTLFVGSRIAGRVYAVTAGADGKREVKVVAKGLHRPNGVAFHDGTLYVAEISRITKYPGIESNLDNPPKPELVYDDLPKDEAHGWKFIKVGPDNKLYVPIGSPGNNLIPPDTHAQIRRMDLDGKNVEVIARGVRNTVGFDWNPKNGNLTFTDNGRDWISEEIPNDELNVLTKTGEHFGYPFCHQGNLPDIEYGWGKKCSDYTPPVGLLGAHTASLGMRFAAGKQFPAQYQGGIFIAQHGSWNKTQKNGGQVVYAKLDANGKMLSYEPFMTGFIENNELIGRPVDVQFAPDGSLLVSDDLNGTIWRVSYDAKSAKHAAK
jgi:glucose/arabinose dehydrogenase